MDNKEKYYYCQNSLSNQAENSSKIHNKFP